MDKASPKSIPIGTSVSAPCGFFAFVSGVVFLQRVTEFVGRGYVVDERSDLSGLVQCLLLCFSDWSVCNCLCCSPM